MSHRFIAAEYEASHLAKLLHGLRTGNTLAGCTT